eukprot:CAMPEP_0184495712 /NCGR_PEP_ID=MMETSP0113_2-20130426/32133_1 /TAXON_ID=91329 /ORGANISM="Norrisiella sphaerica, Strain BC52" /LENGTH=1815 /DNA_ID=CAMNT_0026882025 /DNA_START=167 /DNA_END=5614 /DNA_ORIENTATION=-
MGENQAQRIGLVKKLLEKLMKTETSKAYFNIFKPEEMGELFGNYFREIKRKMDFSDVLAGIEKRKYHTALEVIDDIELVFKNALKFSNTLDDVKKSARLFKNVYIPCLRRRLQPSPKSTNWRVWAESILAELVTDKIVEIELFLTPVDTNRHKDYLKKIKRPMDYGKILRKLKEGKYDSFEAWCADMRLVTDNCKRYNGNSFLEDVRSNVELELEISCKRAKEIMMKKSRTKASKKVRQSNHSSKVAGKSSSNADRKIGVKSTPVSIPMDQPVDARIMQLKTILNCIGSDPQTQASSSIQRELQAIRKNLEQFKYPNVSDFVRAVCKLWRKPDGNKSGSASLLEAPFDRELDKLGLISIKHAIFPPLSAASSAAKTSSLQKFPRKRSPVASKGSSSKISMRKPSPGKKVSQPSIRLIHSSSSTSEKQRNVAVSGSIGNKDIGHSNRNLGSSSRKKKTIGRFEDAKLDKNLALEFLKELEDTKEFEFFKHKVDEKKDQAPGYYMSITQPMWLGKVREHLMSGDYPNNNSFMADLRLIGTNSQKYNAAKTDLYRYGSKIISCVKKWKEKVAGEWRKERERERGIVRMPSKKKFSKKISRKKTNSPFRPDASILVDCTDAAQLIRRLLEDPNSLLFREKVDEVKHSAPGYYAKVKHPMWLLKVLSILEGREEIGEIPGLSAEERASGEKAMQAAKGGSKTTRFPALFLLEAMSQIHKNSLKYNGVNHYITKYAAALKKKFVGELKRLIAKKKSFQVHSPHKNIVIPATTISIPKDTKPLPELETPAFPSKSLKPKPVHKKNGADSKKMEISKDNITNKAPFPKTDSAGNGNSKPASMGPRINANSKNGLESGGVSIKKKKFEPAVKKLKIQHATDVDLTSKEEKQEAPWIREARWILNMLHQYGIEGENGRKIAADFSFPLDPERDKLPRYFEHIKTPMDLGTVEENLNKGNYDCLKTFNDDVKLIFKNAIKYNKKMHQKDSLICINANLLKNELKLLYTIAGVRLRRLEDGTSDSPSPEWTKRAHAAISTCKAYVPSHISPVNPGFYGMKNYFSIVKTPMDLSSLQRRLEGHVYDGGEGDEGVKVFLNDAALMWENARKYWSEENKQHWPQNTSKAVLKGILDAVTELEKRFMDAFNGEKYVPAAARSVPRPTTGKLKAASKPATGSRSAVRLGQYNDVVKLSSSSTPRRLPLASPAKVQTTIQPPVPQPIEIDDEDEAIDLLSNSPKRKKKSKRRKSSTRRPSPSPKRIRIGSNRAKGGDTITLSKKYASPRRILVKAPRTHGSSSVVIPTNRQKPSSILPERLKITPYNSQIYQVGSKTTRVLGKPDRKSWSEYASTVAPPKPKFSLLFDLSSGRKSELLGNKFNMSKVNRNAPKETPLRMSHDVQNTAKHFSRTENDKKIMFKFSLSGIRRGRRRLRKCRRLLGSDVKTSNIKGGDREQVSFPWMSSPAFGDRDNDDAPQDSASSLHRGEKKIASMTDFAGTDKFSTIKLESKLEHKLKKSDSRSSPLLQTTSAAYLQAHIPSLRQDSKLLASMLSTAGFYEIQHLDRSLWVRSCCTSVDEVCISTKDNSVKLIHIRTLLLETRRNRVYKETHEPETIQFDPGFCEHYGWMRKLGGRLEAAASAITAEPDGYGAYGLPALSFPGMAKIVESLKEFGLTPNELQWHERGFYFSMELIGPSDSLQAQANSNLNSGIWKAPSANYRPDARGVFEDPNGSPLPMATLHLLCVSSERLPVLQVARTRFIVTDTPGATSTLIEEKLHASQIIQACIRANEAHAALKLKIAALEMKVENQNPDEAHIGDDTQDDQIETSIE